jgi:tetratricopeptide (TPR) repeat protein
VNGGLVDKIMQEQLQIIETLLARSEIKKAEMFVARHLRSNLTDDERAKALVYRARARLAGGRPEEALDDLLTAQSLLQRAFTQPEMLELLGDCYFACFELASVGFADRMNTKRAQEFYWQIQQAYPDYANMGWVYYQCGRIALTNSDHGLAEDLFRKALFSPSSIKTLTAFCYERLGFIAFYERRAYNEALGFLNKAIDTYPNTERRNWLVQVHILRSRVLREMRNYQLALEAAETAIETATGNNPEDKHSLAEALLTAGELLSGLDGRSRDVLNYLQHFLQISRKPLGVDVTWSRVHEMLGDAYFKLGQYEMAKEAYQNALQYNPYHPWELSLHYRIARSYYQQGNYQAAINAIQQMLSAASIEGETVNDYRAFDILGSAQFALGWYADAADSYLKALELAPANAENLEKIKTYYQFAQELR